MNTARAWRFVHPDLEAGVGAAGLTLSPRGRIALVEGDQAVRQAILLLLSTVPGERIMRPDYGCHLQQLIFSANDDTTAGLAIHYVRRAITQWEPRVEILTLDAGRSENAPEVLTIVLVYRVRASQRVEQLEIALNLAGEVKG
jgi:phage baseplate assembly protein W